ncbi:MAG: hypothetical protein JNL81_00690 [Hyphomonadaceae bacterium]|nr:hypothetical protein [Hyphomonadaceae bacterium]
MLTRRSFAGASAGLLFAPGAFAEPLGDISGDIAILRDAYETLHPGLYRYNTPHDMSARFDALARAWSRPQTRGEAYLSLSRFLATIKCGHTYANFYNQSEQVQGELFDAQRLLPFHFAWIDDRMVVLRTQSSDPRLGHGAEILSIDGRSTRGILRALMPYARADGSNDDKRRALLEVRGYDRYETFDVFYSLQFRPGASVRLRARPSNSERTETFDAATIGLATRRSLLVADPDGNAAVWTLAFPRPQTARLTMPTWALYNSEWNWRAFLDQSFAEIAARNATKLIIDIRGNEGGDDCGDLIAARLTDTPIAREGYARRTRYRQTPERLDQYLDTWDRSFRDWGDDATVREDGFYDLRGETDADQIEPLGPRFRGAVDVLIDSQNSSATFQFASCIKNNRLGRLIGAPTGGSQRGINGGAFFFLRLPASGLEADVPLIGRFPMTPKPDAGLLPDVAIALTREDIANGRDATLEFALS